MIFYRSFLISFLVLYGIATTAQYRISGKVSDSLSGKPLEYCNISIPETQKGSISNSDGAFSIEVESMDHRLHFSYLGYHSITISASELLNNPNLYMSPREMLMKEVAVYAEDDLLYRQISKCRKRLRNNYSKHIAKAYYGIQTRADDQPLELLECYYNADVSGEQINKLLFKAGRVGLAKVDNGYFQTYNTAKAISKLPITATHYYYPGNPFQFGKSKMKKLFKLESGYIEGKIQVIKFEPKKQKNELFSGEIWFNNETFQVLKIHLYTNNTTKHPFEAKHKNHSISDVSLDISYTYSNSGEEILIDHIGFKYGFNYHSIWRKDSINSLQANRNTIREISSKGIIRLYDYNEPFIIPYFKYPDNLYYGDYHRMEFLPYNADFWSSNNQVLLTESQKASLGFFAEKGQLTNYWDETKGLTTLEKIPVKRSNKDELFEFNYIYWNPKKRISLKKVLNEKTFEEVKTQNINASDYQILIDNTKYRMMSASMFRKDKYSLKCQLFLDVTKIEDSLHCISYTVFDNFKSYYALEENVYTNTILNIYFDICEIERRKMELALENHHNSLEEINRIYLSANESMHQITSTFLEEIDLGRKPEYVEKWNNYVLKHLGIDNLIFNSLYQ